MTIHQAIRSAREFFNSRMILEVRTPKLVPSGALEPYIDTLAVSSANLKHSETLATSPEFSLKKLWLSEINRSPDANGIYEITPVFRDDAPGKYHSVEFTMIEWYLKNASMNEILESAAALIKNLGGASEFSNLDAREVFRRAGVEFDFGDVGSIAQAYRVRHGMDPTHVNALDLGICCYNLLFDEIVVPEIKARSGLVAVSPYPACLAAMAFVESGEAQRAEIYWRGLEIANAYREEWQAAPVRERWLAYNEIRRLRRVREHPIDETLLASLANLEGSAGIALGLERVLTLLAPIS